MDLEQTVSFIHVVLQESLITINQFKNYCITITWLLFICGIKTTPCFWPAIYWWI